MHTSSVLRKSLVLYSTISPDGFSLESSSTASDARLNILPMSCMGVYVKEAGSRRKKKESKEGRGGAVKRSSNKNNGQNFLTLVAAVTTAPMGVTTP